jgi:hypothetical protein
MMRMNKVVFVRLAISHVQTPTSVFPGPGFVMASFSIVQEEKMRIRIALLVEGLNAMTQDASHRAGYVMRTKIVRVERMKRIVVFAAGMSALMVAVFLTTGYVIAPVTVPMMRLTVYAMRMICTNVKTECAYQMKLFFATELTTAETALTKKTAQRQRSQPFLLKGIP